MSEQFANKKVLSTREAAQYIGVSKQRLDMSRSSGKLCGADPPKFFRVGTKMIRYRITDLDQWLEERETFSTMAEETAAEIAGEG